MKSALRTFTSALGVCAACYLLATASWQQVLLLFLIASIGWCWFAFSVDAHDEPKAAGRAPNTKPRVVPARKAAPPAQPAFAQEAAPRPERVQRIQKVYRFPIHELTRPSLSPISDFD
jgi:hypothetical protein